MKPLLTFLLLGAAAVFVVALFYWTVIEFTSLDSEQERPAMSFADFAVSCAFGFFLGVSLTVVVVAA